MLNYLKGPRSDSGTGAQKVLKPEEVQQDEVNEDKKGEVEGGEGGEEGKTAEELRKEEEEKAERKKKQDKITFYSFLTAVGVIIFSVIGGMML